MMGKTIAKELKEAKQKEKEKKDYQSNILFNYEKMGSKACYQ
jgi:hypothetical protein